MNYVQSSFRGRKIGKTGKFLRDSPGSPGTESPKKMDRFHAGAEGYQLGRPLRDCPGQDGTLKGATAQTRTLRSVVIYWFISHRKPLTGAQQGSQEQQQ